MPRIVLAIDPAAVTGLVVFFRVYGTPQTAGSKQAFPYKKPTGQLGVRVSDDNPKSRSWKQQIIGEALANASEDERTVLLASTIAVRFSFVMPRPKSHFKADGSIKPNAPRWHTKRPDALKMARAAEDALTGVLWADDSQIVLENLEKRYADKGEVEHLAVTVHAVHESEENRGEK